MRFAVFFIVCLIIPFTSSDVWDYFLPNGMLIDFTDGGECQNVYYNKNCDAWDEVYNRGENLQRYCMCKYGQGGGIDGEDVKAYGCTMKCGIYRVADAKPEQEIRDSERFEKIQDNLQESTETQIEAISEDFSQDIGISEVIDKFITSLIEMFKRLIV